MACPPSVYRKFTQCHPDAARRFGQLAEQCHPAGPLEDRTRWLVELGIAMGLSSEGAVRSHTRRALEAGIPLDEVEHVIMLALTTAGFTTMIAADKWAHEVA